MGHALIKAMLWAAYLQGDLEEYLFLQDMEKVEQIQMEETLQDYQLLSSDQLKQVSWIHKWQEN